MWRHSQYIKLLPVFVILFTICVLAGGFLPYYYDPIWILYGYSFCNIWMFLMQYLYYTPESELTQRQTVLEIFSENYSIKSDIEIDKDTNI